MRKPERFACGKNSVVGPVKGKPGTFGYVCLFCGSYRCDRCRIPKLKKVRSAIARIASEMGLNKLATLTLDRKKIKKVYSSSRLVTLCLSLVAFPLGDELEWSEVGQRLMRAHTVVGFLPAQ